MDFWRFYDIAKVAVAIVLQLYFGTKPNPPDVPAAGLLRVKYELTKIKVATGGHNAPCIVHSK